MGFGREVGEGGGWWILDLRFLIMDFGLEAKNASI